MLSNRGMAPDREVQTVTDLSVTLKLRSNCRSMVKVQKVIEK